MKNRTFTFLLIIPFLISCTRSKDYYDSVEIEKKGNAIFTYEMPSDSQIKKDIEYIVESEITIRDLAQKNRRIYDMMNIWPGNYVEVFVANFIKYDNVCIKYGRVIVIIDILYRYNINYPFNARQLDRVCTKFIKKELSKENIANYKERYPILLKSKNEYDNFAKSYLYKD